MASVQYVHLYVDFRWASDDERRKRGWKKMGCVAYAEATGAATELHELYSKEGGDPNSQVPNAEIAQAFLGLLNRLGQDGWRLVEWVPNHRRGTYYGSIWPVGDFVLIREG